MPITKATYRCPACREGVRFALREYVGREIECPACHVSLKVNPDGFEQVDEDASDSHPVGAVSPPKSGLGEVARAAAIGIALVLVIVVAVQMKLPEPVAIRSGGDPLTERNAPEPSVASTQKAIEEPLDSSSDESGWEPVVADESKTVAKVDQPSVDLLPPPLKERPAVVGRSDRSEPAADLLNERPIVVQLATWDPEAVPLVVPVEGALAQRTEDRLSMRLSRFETSRPTAVIRLLQTLADAAGVAIELPVRGLVDETSLAVSEATIATLLDELLDAYGADWSIRDDGVVVVSLER